MTKKERKNSKLRHNEYYDMQEVLDSLYSKSVKGEIFTDLMQYITDENNIKLAYRNIKSNKGSITAGTDGKRIKDISCIDVNSFVQDIQKRLLNYQPKAVRRVEIPKPGSDKTRPLGIPTIYDRIIQQCILQVLEPICEAKFHENSNGFRPNRSAENALAQCYKYMQRSNLHYCVDIDIKGFFDNVNHSKLLKQIWSMGIRDKQLLTVIRKMLKAPVKMIDGTVYYPNKGTPQGGILSPLLSNIVLNELDWWISSNWENIPTERKYCCSVNKSGSMIKSTIYRELRKTNLKEMYIVRYADDFKIFCRTKTDAVKTFYAVTDWLKNRLNLEISTEKSKVVNLKRHYSDFLGFKLKVHKKNNSYVVKSRMSDKAISKETKMLIDQIYLIKRPKDSKEQHKAILTYNSMVIGIHNYYEHATDISVDCRKIAFRVDNVFKQWGNTKTPKELESTKDMNVGVYVKERYGGSEQVRYIHNNIVVPIGYVKTKKPIFKKKSINKYTVAGREEIHKSLGVNMSILHRLMRNPVNGRSLQYADNRISLYAGQYGKCAVTGLELAYDEIHCHHIVPRNRGGTDKYDNLVIVHKDIHKLIHASNIKVIEEILTEFAKTLNVKKLNRLRKSVGNTEISLDKTVTG